MAAGMGDLGNGGVHSRNIAQAPIVRHGIDGRRDRIRLQSLAMTRQQFRRAMAAFPGRRW